MKHKLLLAFVAAFALAACNGDEIDELKDRVNTLEEITGSNEPITGTLTTTNDADDDFVKKNTYYFKAGAEDTHGMWDNGDGTYYVYVERFSDVDWNNGAWFQFNYNPETGEVTNPYAGMYHEYSERYVNAYIYPGSYTDNVVTVTVNGFNVASGKINVTVHATTSDASENNPFTGNALTLDLSFKGTLQFFEESND
jgi:hypothetical protein